MTRLTICLAWLSVLKISAHFGHLFFIFLNSSIFHFAQL